LVLGQGPAPAAPGKKALVLPTRVPAETSEEVRGAVAGVEQALWAALQRHSDWQMADQSLLETLTREAATAQLMGCDDTSCLVQLAEAVSVDALVVSRLSRQEGVWDYQVSLVERQEGRAARRSWVKARSLDALLASVDSAARELAKGSQMALSDPDLPRRLGTTPDVVKALREEAGDRPLTEAWTAYILSHNTESDALALAQGALVMLSGASLLLTTVLFTPVVIMSNQLIYDVGPRNYVRPDNVESSNGLYPLPYMLVPWFAAMGLTVVVSWVPLLLAGVLAAVDALDLGRKPVSREGCCRDEEAVRDAANPGLGRKVAPFLAAVGAGLAFFTLTGSICGAMLWSGPAANMVKAVPALRMGLAVPEMPHRVSVASLVLVLGALGMVVPMVAGFTSFVATMGLAATAHRPVVDDEPLKVEPKQAAPPGTPPPPA
jgi:hypothetical protein